MVKKQKQINFKSRASMPKEALALIFDLQGFSNFFSQPDVQGYVSVFLNRVFECFSIIFNGGKAYWLSEQNYEPLLQPVHMKFLGDGALFIWTFKADEFESNKRKIMILTNRLWNLKTDFEKIVKKCSEDIPVVELPKKIRIGLAAGSVYKLSHTDSNTEEYIGYCINLASRLQGYCRDLGFIASARIRFTDAELKKYRYVKVVAKNLKGFPKEIVVVDKNEYERLKLETKRELFDEIDS